MNDENPKNPVDLSRRRFLAEATALATLPLGGCSRLLPKADHNDPKVQAAFDFIDQVLTIEAPTGLYGTSLATGAPVLLQPLLPDKPILVPQAEIPLKLVALILAIEDQLFFLHDGVNFDKLIAAGHEFLLKGRANDSSTLNQQIARTIPDTPVNIAWTAEKKALAPNVNKQGIDRKSIEIAWAKILDERFSKEELAKLYFNLPYLGQRPGSLTPIQIHGLLAASWTYFGQEKLDSLTLAQMAHLAGMLHNPLREAPSLDDNKGRDRRLKVLQELLDFKDRLSQQIEEGLLLDRDRDFGIELLNAINTDEIREALQDFNSPKLIAKAPYSAPSVVRVIEELRTVNTHYLYNIPQSNIFTRIETTLLPEAQGILAETLSTISLRYQQAPVTGIIVTKEGDIIALGAVRSAEQHPFNLPLQGGSVLGPLRGLVEIGGLMSPNLGGPNIIPLKESRSSKRGVSHPLSQRSIFNVGNLDAEITYLEENSGTWGVLKTLLERVILRNSDHQSLKLQHPSDLRGIKLPPAEIVRLYLSLIRTSADIPNDLGLVTTVQDVYSGKSLEFNRAERRISPTGVYAGGNVPMLDLIRYASLTVNQPDSKKSIDHQTDISKKPAIITLNPGPTDDPLATISMTPEYICLITVGVTTIDLQMRNLIAMKVREDCSGVLARVDDIFKGLV